MSCNLPGECDCEACQWWSENGFDKSRDPVWQKYPEWDDEEEQ